MIDRYSMSGPEEGDTIDQTVLVCDDDGTELIEIRAGTLEERKTRANMIAHLLNASDAEFNRLAIAAIAEQYARANEYPHNTARIPLTF